MQNTFWKMTSLAGVIGIGCLVVLQVQKGLDSTQNEAPQQVLEGADTGSPPSADDESSADPFEEFGRLGIQSEPTPSDADSTASAGPWDFGDSHDDDPAPSPDGGLSFVDQPQTEFDDDENPFADNPSSTRTTTPADRGATAATFEPSAEDSPFYKDEPAGRVSVDLAGGDDQFGPDEEDTVADRGPVVGYPGADYEVRREAESKPTAREPGRLFDGTGSRQPTNDVVPQPTPVDQIRGAVADREDSDGSLPIPQFPARLRQTAAQGDDADSTDVKSIDMFTTDDQPATFDQPKPSPESEDDENPFVMDLDDATEPAAIEDRQPTDRQPTGRGPRMLDSLDGDLFGPNDPPNRSPAPVARDDEPDFFRSSDDETVVEEESPRRSLEPSPNYLRSPPAAGDELLGTGTIERTTIGASLRPQLRIEKTAPDSAVVGQAMIYKIIVRNTGSATAREVTVEDRIPRGSRLTGTIPRAELTQGRLIWKYSELEPGEEREIAVRVVPTDEGEIGSITTVNFKAEVAAHTRVTAPRLRFQVAGPTEVKMGEPVVYQYHIRNEGTGRASNVLIRNLIPAGLKHPDGSDLEYEIGDLAPGASREVTLKLVAAEPGDVINHAVVTADGGFTDDADAQLSILGSQLEVTRRGPVRRYIGREAEFENTVTNSTKREALESTVIEHIPEGMKFVEASAGGQYNENKHWVAWKIPRLGAEEHTVLRVTLVPLTSGDHMSRVQVIEDAGFESETRSTTSVEDLVTMGLGITGINGPVAVGETVTCRIRARNRGTAAVTNVELTLTVPKDLKIVAAGPVKASQLGDEVTFSALTSIAANDHADFEIRLKAESSAGNREHDVRLKARIKSDQIRIPLSTEEAILIFSDAEQ